MAIDIYNPESLAVIILTFFAGILIAKVFSSRGIGGCITYLLGLVVVVLVINALLQGYSVYFERITLSLQNYVYFNFAGVIGAIGGFLLGLLIFRKKR